MMDDEEEERDGRSVFLLKSYTISIESGLQLTTNGAYYKKSAHCTSQYILVS